MTYNVFGGTLNLAQSINQQYRAACDGSYQSYRVFSRWISQLIINKHTKNNKHSLCQNNGRDWVNCPYTESFLFLTEVSTT